ncbi:hypothetical protein U5903_04170 [Cereibacter johrii]|uniref:hypothetical protein n=1 Tax=Cereibacter johrii TaxID=445629 RepID=UPI002B259A7D|nr:hypothetical protein [Cereibacter johrii]MEA5159964.1 hypothetical protein [Cereibacter johrii]
MATLASGGDAPRPIGSTPFTARVAGPALVVDTASDLMVYEPHTTSMPIDVRQARAFTMGLSSPLHVVPLIVEDARPGVGGRMLDIQVLLYPHSVPAWGGGHCVVQLWVPYGRVEGGGALPADRYEGLETDLRHYPRRTGSTLDFALRLPGGTDDPAAVSVRLLWYERLNLWRFYASSTP